MQISISDLQLVQLPFNEAISLTAHLSLHDAPHSATDVCFICNSIYASVSTVHGAMLRMSDCCLNRLVEVLTFIE